MIKRRKTKTIKIGPIKTGHRFPVSIQSMAKTDTACVYATVKEIKALEKAGCEIVRVAVKDKICAQALGKIRTKTNIPLVADIHFNYRLALEAIKQGVDAIRLNPGNIYRKEEVKKVALAAKLKKIPIRVGVNSGSLRNTKYEIRNTKLANSMIKSALDYIRILESTGFYDIIVSLKASDVITTVKAYRKLARLCDYPFHLGITASGLPEEGTIKSAIGIGTLLLEGIGDTIRVSLTAAPEQEVKVAKQILQALGLRKFYPEIISCPTCGRCQIDLLKLVQKVNQMVNDSRFTIHDSRPVKLAIMGCEVNGPGEAKDADLGIAAGRVSGLLFRKGKVIKKIKQTDFVKEVFKQLER